eukprot:scaffold766_cov343-Pavlova_lutheri.AAC.3
MDVRLADVRLGSPHSFPDPIGSSARAFLLPIGSDWIGWSARRPRPVSPFKKTSWGRSPGGESPCPPVVRVGSSWVARRRHVCPAPRLCGGAKLVGNPGGCVVSKRSQVKEGREDPSYLHNDARSKPGHKRIQP